MHGTWIDRGLALRRGAATAAVLLALLGLSGCSPQETETAEAETSETAAAANDDRLLAQTQAGTLEGFRQDGVVKFKGVHYGASTADSGRFLPPQPVPAWEGVRDASEFGPICPQTGIVATGADDSYVVGPIPELPQSEDCLVLNVWTPALDGQRPVMVWLHGRGFREGAGSEGWYDGTGLARHGDVVTITLNHRLNGFGYLHLGGLGGEQFENSGVAGMLDIVLALEWVRDNIEAFGGDPDNVTIFGESGGGFKVSTLMAMPEAEGLFHKAIIQSGAALTSMAPEVADANARLLLAELGLEADQLEALQSVPFEEISEAIVAIERRQEGGMPGSRDGFGFAPVVGSSAFPHHPFEPQPSPHARDVAVMIGTTLHEMTLLSLGDPHRGDLSESELQARMTQMIGEEPTAELLEIYRADFPDATPWDLYIAFLSDRVFRIPSIRLAERQSAVSEQPVYKYLFTWESDFGDPPMRAAHALEIPFVFGTADVVPLTGSRPGQDALTRMVQGAWAAFAHHGSPGHADLPEWAPYDTDARFTMILDVPSWPSEDPLGAARAAWETIPLD